MARKAAHMRVGYYDPCWGNEELSTILEFMGGAYPRSCIKELVLRIEKRLGVRAIPTDSGRSAIALGIRAIGLRHGDEVLVPSYVCPAAVSPIVDSGCQVRFVDIDKSLCANPASLQASVSSDTKAVLIVHQFGRMARVEGLNEIALRSGLEVIDDAGSAFGAQWHGKPAGTMGKVGILSFGPGKIISSVGGGMLLCRDDSIFERALAMPGPPKTRLHQVVTSLEIVGRSLPWTHLEGVVRRLRRIMGEERYDVLREPGWWDGKIREMGALSAEIALIQLEKYSSARVARRKNWRILENELRKIAGLQILPGGGDENAMQECPILVPESKVSHLLRRALIHGYELETGWRPLHLLDRFERFPRADLSRTEETWKKVVLLPIHPRVSPADARAIAGIIRSSLSPSQVSSERTVTVSAPK